jgi:hypothetical protein
MGFGYGHKTSHSGQAVNRETGERVASRFSNDMAAHVWAQRTQTFGQSSAWRRSPESLTRRLQPKLSSTGSTHNGAR